MTKSILNKFILVLSISVLASACAHKKSTDESSTAAATESAVLDTSANTEGTASCSAETTCPHTKETCGCSEMTKKKKHLPKSYRIRKDGNPKRR